MSPPEHTSIWVKAKAKFSRFRRKKNSPSPAASSASKRDGDEGTRTKLAVASTSATSPPIVTAAPNTIIGNASDSDGSNYNLGAGPPISTSPDTSVFPEKIVKTANSACKAIENEAIENVGTEEEHVTNNASSAVDEKLWYSEKTPKWNEAVEEWKAGHVKEFDELMQSARAANKSAADESGDWLLRLRPAEKSSKQTAARLKRWQPVLASVRGIAMAAAAFDHHKIAPIVCASVLFGLDILFHCMNPEDRDKILDILCQCGNTVKECNSFEINFRKASHPSIESSMPKVNELLIQQYTTALNLAYKLRHACQGMQLDFVKSPENQTAGQNEDSKPVKSRTERFGDWFKRRGKLLWVKMSHEVLEWEGGSKELGRLKAEWGVRKDDLKETIAADENTVAVRDWLRKKGYPDPSPSDIKDRVMRHYEYSNGADWFLNGDEFAAFCDGFRSSSEADHTQDSRGPPGESQTVSQNSAQEYLAAKRVLWLSGGYGTGKTTILYLTYLALSTYAEPQFACVDDLRIIPYFCNGAEIGTRRADCETIIRAMIRRMALSPNLTLAEPANAMCIKQKSATAQDGELSLKRDWEPLFEKWIEINSGKCHFVLLVDALDECAEASEWEELLKFLNYVINKHSNVSLICSSHAHVELDSFFATSHQEGSIDFVAAVYLTEEKTAAAIKAYIAGELTRRKFKARKSVFYQEKHKSLLANFEKLLLANAKGMFRWVEIWLELLIPETQVGGKTIEFDQHAKKRLKELEEDTTPNFDPDQRLTKAYQRLWDLNSTADSTFVGDIRTRLFQLVQVAAEPLNTKTLSAILRIRAEAYEDYPTADNVKSLVANFLVEYDASPDPENRLMRLRYIHESAREFVINLCRPSGDAECSKTLRQMYEKQSHLSIVRVFIDAFSCLAHPIWRSLPFDPRKWRDAVVNTEVMADWYYCDESQPLWRAFNYLATHSFRHCTLAADKGSLFDPLWQEVLDRVILSSESAFGMMIATETFIEGLKIPHFLSRLLIWREHDRLEILPAHVLAILNIIHEDDINVPYDTLDIGVTSTANNNHVIKRSWFQHADYTGSFSPSESPYNRPLKATALQLACVAGNCAAARMIFQAAQIYCDDPIESLLLNESQDCNVPLSIAIEAGRLDLARTLLELERSAISGEEFNADRSPAAKFVSKQWSSRIIEFGESLLLRAMRRFTDSEFFQLLEVAQPVDIDARNKDGETLLHIAAGIGRRTTVCRLVDTCGANPNARTNRDLTPVMYAAAIFRRDIVADLQARGADTEAETPEWYREEVDREIWEKPIAKYPVFDPVGRLVLEEAGMGEA